VEIRENLSDITVSRETAGFARALQWADQNRSKSVSAQDVRDTRRLLAPMLGKGDVGETRVLA
jgi:hypothetical protein